MKYYAIESLVDAWQYTPGADVPIWVSRHWHSLGDGGLTGRDAGGVLVTARRGMWVVRVVCEGEELHAAMTHEEFTRIFRPAVPPAAVPSRPYQEPA